jgi:hypothetical protein
MRAADLVSRLRWCHSGSVARPRRPWRVMVVARRLGRQLAADLASVDAAVHSVAYAALPLQHVRRHAVWIVAGRFFATQPLIAKHSVAGDVLLPVVLIGIGLLILIEGGAFGL